MKFCIRVNAIVPNFHFSRIVINFYYCQYMNIIQWLQILSVVFTLYDTTSSLHNLVLIIEQAGLFYFGLQAHQEKENSKYMTHLVRDLTTPADKIYQLQITQQQTLTWRGGGTIYYRGVYLTYLYIYEYKPFFRYLSAVKFNVSCSCRYSKIAFYLLIKKYSKTIKKKQGYLRFRTF